MARNGSGTYSLVAGNPVTTGTTISSTWANNTLSDIASALTQSLSKDGQTTATGNLPMGNNKLTGLSAGTTTGDSARFDQIFSQGAPTDISSASTTDIGGQYTNFLNVTGTTTITSLGTNYNGPKMLKFTGVLILTYNSTTLITPSAASITTAAGDTCIAIPKSTSSGTADGWQIIAYQRATGLPLITTGFALSGANVDITSLGNNTTTVYTTAGTSTAYTITPTPVISAYAIGQSFVVNFNAASGASPTLQISGIATPPNLVKQLPDGTYSNIAANDIPINHRSRVTLISTTQALVEKLGSVVFAGGTAPVFGARAWCTFNGTTVGTNAPTAGGNVSTVVRNAAGDYTVNFTTAMQDANYSVSLMVGSSSGTSLNIPMVGTSRTTYPTTGIAAGSFRFTTMNASGSAVDPDVVQVIVIR